MILHKLELLFLSNLYEAIEALCRERDITVTEMCRRLDVPRSTLSELKSGRSKSLGAKHLTKIAELFEVSVDYLLGAEKENAPAKMAGADNELLEMLEDIRRRPDLKVLFSLSKKATPEEIQKSIKIIKTICGDDDGGSYS